MKSDVAADHESLLMKLDGLARVAQVGVGVAEVAQGIAFPAPVAGAAGGCDGGPQPGDAITWNLAERKDGSAGTRESREERIG